MNLLYPAFLGALAAIGIPILIHLSQRRKFKELKIGTLRFLQQVEQKRNLRLRVEQWPLLALRILALVLLAFLFARPFFSDRHRTEAGTGKTIVLLDGSGSMTASMTAEAKKAAAVILAKESGATLARFSDAVQVLASLEDYEAIPGAPGDFSKALGWSLDRLRAEGTEQAKVVMIGHFAAAQMPSSPPRVWPPRVAVETIAIEPPDEPNAAVRTLELLTPFAGAAMEIEARVTPSSKVREVSLAAEGLNLKQRIPAEAERVLFSFRPPRDEVRGSISIEGKDPWPADDRRPFAMRWAEPEPVMILDGFPGSTPFEGQGYFLQKALSASGAAHGLSPFRPEISFGLESDTRGATREQFIAPNRTVPTQAKPKAIKDFSGFSAYAICGPTSISSGEATILKTAVEKGAGLIILLDGRWTPEATAALEAIGLFPPGIRLSGGMQQRRIASWDKEHPAFAAFNGSDGGDLRSLLWRDSFALPADDSWKAIATLDGGHPILLERKSSDPAQGRVMVLAHPLTREWSDLPREPIFVPFAKSLFTTLTRYEARPHTANVRTPGATEKRAIGIYDTAEGGSEVVAADSSETSVTAVDAAAFRKAFALPDVDPEPVPPADSAPQRQGSEQPREGEWWQWLVLGLLIVLTVECALATRRSTEPATPLDA